MTPPLPLPPARQRAVPSRPLLVAAATAAAALACGTTRPPAPDAPPQQFDVVITNARIVDGTGNPWYYGDVAVRGDRIARVAPAGALAAERAPTRIDARGLVVAPGFIDVQSHSWDQLLFADGRVVSKVTQGVTTEILGEATTPAPINDRVLALYDLGPTDTVQARLYGGFTGRRGFARWLEAMEAHRRSVNVGSFLGATTVRAYAKGQSQGAASPAELDTMRAVVREAMRDGAFGVSSALIYPPGSYATTDELIAQAQAMAPYHGVYITHMRSEDDSLLEAIDEALRVGREGGVPVEIYHLKAAGRRNWPKAEAMVATIDSARAAGQDVGATMYPYAASANGLSACFPPSAAENGRLLANLRDPAGRARILRQMTDTTPGAPDYCQRSGPSTYMVVGFERPELKRYEGMRLDAIAAAMGKPWAETVVELTLAEGERLDKINFSMSEENVAMQLRRPWVIVGSDAGGADPERAEALVHPRAYGTYPRILGRYVREERVLALEDAVRKMTSAVAQRLSLRDRGLVREGMLADLVVFDPATVADRATFADPHRLSTGILDVFVNGVAVVRGGRHTGATPGRVVRGPGYGTP